MGMTINEAIEGLHDIQKYYNDDSDAMFLGFDDKDNKSVDFAIDTMRKYQKIEMIIRRYDATWEFHHMKYTIDKIREVLEDGRTWIGR